MKASEVIAQLQKIIEEWGDPSVYSVHGNVMKPVCRIGAANKSCTEQEKAPCWYAFVDTVEVTT